MNFQMLFQVVLLIGYTVFFTELVVKQIKNDGVCICFMLPMLLIYYIIIASFF